MRKLDLNLENCYGIRKLEHTFDFSICNTKLIYASNGVMKTSFAKTFMDLTKGEDSKDLMFRSRTAIRKIVDENGNNIIGNQVFVMEPYNEQFHSNKISTLLVNRELKQNYDEIHRELNGKKEQLLQKLKKHSGFKGNIEDEILKTCRLNDDNFFACLEHLNYSSALDFGSIDYNEIFNTKVVSFLEDESVRRTIGEYIEKYNQLLESSLYFKKGVFTHNNAENVYKNLDKDGFFNAEHCVLLNNRVGNDQNTQKITKKEEFVQVIKEEKEKILNDPDLIERFHVIDTQITKNAELREFRSYLEINQQIIPELLDLDQFKINLWRSYLKKEEDLCEDLLTQYHSVKERVKTIIEKARSEKTDWENVINIFNNRFSVPFKLEIQNQEDVILKNNVPTVSFIFEDFGDQHETNISELLTVLSNGEKKALYILNIIFEIEERKKNSIDNLFIFDDVADSFDYKNKYAIIEYLIDFSKKVNFYSIIMTHNFDFFRTIQNRFPLKRENCYMTIKTNDEVKLVKAEYLNPFNYFKSKFTSDEIFLIASIPFVRNLIEYTKDNKDTDYLYLTSLLHVKNDSNSITITDLVTVFNRVFPNKNFNFSNGTISVTNKIFDLANSFLPSALEINLEKKIILSIATRLKAEKFMIEPIPKVILC